MRPLEVLHERPALPAYDLPAALREAYGGPIGFPVPRLVANFVASVDGVVTIPEVPNPASFISRRSEHDRFVMGLLRAGAGGVLIGAETLRAEPDHRWTPAHVAPDLADAFASLRAELGLAAEPELAVVTSSGDLDPEIPALAEALVVTGHRGAGALRDRGLTDDRVVVVDANVRVPARAAVDALRSRGHAVILSEAGPALTSQLLADHLVDELFLTVSPIVVGRGGDGRPGFADGVDLLPGGPPEPELLSVRRADSHLFLRYAFGGTD